MKTVFAVAAIILIPMLCWLLYPLEFALEPPPPGHGYVLDPLSRIGLATFLVVLAVTWFVAAIYLLRRLRPKSRVI